VSYTVGKAAANGEFIDIGTVTTFSFWDDHPQDGSNVYRIRATAGDGRSYYSGVVTIAADAAGLSTMYLTGNTPGSATALVANMLSDCRGVIVIYSPLGQVLQKRSVQLYKGYNSIDLPAVSGQAMSAAIVA
jgi:hypothetical protein